MTLRRTRTAALTAGALAVALVLTGCVGFLLPQRPGSEGPGGGSAPTGESVAAELAPYYGQSLDWQKCGTGMECATASAPMDWANAASGVDVELALVRQKATGRDRLGSLLINPGGPGGSGYDFVKESVDYATSEALQKQYDIVGFDPRGVGRSSAVSCLTDAEMDDYLYTINAADKLETGSSAWITDVTAQSEAFGQSCLDSTGALLEFVDTESAARDLDMLRAVLGDKALNFLGYSYGTFLGATYAELFSDNVGRLVLDGAIDPSTSNFEVSKTQAIGFENALRSYLTDCLSNSDCPFSGTVDDGMATIKKLLDSVEANPIRNTDGRMLGSSTLLTGIIYPLYDAGSWTYLSGMFEDVMAGNASYAFSFADGYNGRNDDGTYSDNSTEAFTAINCLDYAFDADPVRMRAEAAEIAAAAPVMGEYMSYGDIGCSVWPFKTRTDRTQIAAAGSADILVVGTTGDPATPYEWAVALADQLESGHLITYEGEGHTAYNKSNSCVNDAVDDFFLKGTVPASDPMC